MPSGHPGHQGSRTPGSSWYPIDYSCPSFFLTHPSRRYGILILKFIVTFKRAGKATAWRRLSLPSKHYNNYWWPNVPLEGIHNTDEGLNQTARYKHYSRTYYLSPPPPTPYPRATRWWTTPLGYSGTSSDFFEQLCRFLLFSLKLNEWHELKIKKALHIA